MRAIILGATGMVGQALLRECLLDPGVDAVLVVGRRPTGQQSAKLREIIHENGLDYSSIQGELAGYDACFCCLGITSAGTEEANYQHITYSIPVAAAQTLVRLNPGMTFVYVSGAGADSSGTSRTMWKRIKGNAENALLAMPFRGVYIFRPAFIQPLHGIRSRTKLYNLLYSLLAPLYPVLKTVAPGYATTTEKLGRALIAAARKGFPKRILESKDINALGEDGYI
jgi:uncharacterized protein YbjT (DUF2867 family)